MTASGRFAKQRRGIPAHHGARSLLTGVAGLFGGVLLAAVPNGSLLHADPAALEGSPFSNWRMPGVMAGAGLLCFEAAELAWIGFQPLQAVFAIIGVAIVILAWRRPRPRA
jgi:hypothetical protein